MTNETINDIIRELREYGDRPPPRRAWIDIADRLDAAYKRDMKSMCTSWWRDMLRMTVEVERLREENLRLKAELNKDDCLKLANDVDRLLAENERLKEALKPVLEVEWPTGISGGIDNQLLEPLTCICDAVRSAQLIYNGGAK